MLVDENGHGKGLSLNRRGGELYGENAIFLKSQIKRPRQGGNG